MASAIPFFSPNYGDKPWVDQISKTLQTQLAVTIDTPPVSIFEIPKTQKSEKLEAYVPQRIGIGPNHHFQPELHQKMEQNKITAVKRVLKPCRIHDIQHIVNKIRDIVPVMRGCYDLYLDADDDTLAWLFAIDGLFLLDQLGSYSDHQFALVEAKDLIMLENQIPLIVLKEIQNALFDENANVQEDYLEFKIKTFCESHSPFVLAKEKIDFSRVHHLIDYMYQFIVNNETLTPRKVNFTNSETDAHEKDDAKIVLLEAVIKIAGLIPVAQPFLKIVEFIKQKFPGISTDEQVTVEEIKVPSVSELSKYAGVKFRLSPENGGIRNIKFVLEKERSVYLPFIKLNYDSEIILRNLVAYEQLMAMNCFNNSTYGLELTEYVDFMCGIIDSSKDVKLLRNEKIIVGELEDEEIVRLFNGISRSRGKMNGESELWKTVARLNKVYESMPIVWVRRFAQKQLLVLAKVLVFLVTISSILIMFREAYLNAYCSKLVRILRSKLSLILR